MSFFTNLRADRLVTEIRSSNDPASPARQKAIARLKEVGAGAIEPVLGALPEADKSATMGFVEVLSHLVNQKTFPLFVRGLDRGQPAGHLRHLLGAHQQPQLPPSPAARGAGHPGDLQARGAGCDRRAEVALRGARAAHRRLRPGAEREGGAVPHHRRHRRPLLDRGAARPRQRQGPDRARAHHQHARPLQHPGGADRAAGAAQGPQQAHPRGHALGAAAHGRPDRHPAGHRACCATRRSTCSTARSTW